MGEKTLKKIEEARAQGYTDEQIMSAFSKKFNAAAVATEEQESFFKDHGLAHPEAVGRPVSAITGMPLQTGVEKIEASKEAMRQMPAFMGDIYGTFMAPQPFKGGLLAKAGNLALRGIGAGAGSGVGEFVGQKLFGEDVSQEKIEENVLLGAGGEVGFSGIAATAKGLMRLGKNLTISGNVISEWIRNNVKKKTTDRAIKFIEDLAPPEVRAAGSKIDVDDLGLSISEAFDEARIAYNLYGDHVDDMARSEGGYVLLDDTTQMLSDLRQKWTGEISEAFDLKRPIRETSPAGFVGPYKRGPEFYAVTRRFPEGRPSDLGSETKIIDGIDDIYGWKPRSKQSQIVKVMVAEDMIHPEDLKMLLAEFWKKGRKSDWASLTATQRANREKLKKTILVDIEKFSPEAVELKGMADKSFGAVANFQRIASIYNNKNAIKTLPSGDKYLNPTGLANSIYSKKNVIIDTMGKDVWKKMKAEADFYKKMAVNWRPPSASTAKQIAGRMSPAALGTTALAISHPALIPITESFGAISAYALLKGGDKQILKDLAKYVVKPAAKAGAHFGIGPHLPLLPAHSQGKPNIMGEPIMFD